VQLTLYSRAFNRVAGASSGPYPRGWVSVPLPPDFAAARKAGAYYWVLQAQRGTAQSKALKGVCYFTH
jgi:hypothetical protein